MDNAEALLFLFSDNLMDALILPPHAAYAWKVMLIFGSYPLSTIWGIATLGSVAGMVLNWGFGKILLTCRQKEIIIMESDLIDKSSVLFTRYGVWLLLFSWIPVIGTLTVIASGFLSVRFLPMLVLVSIAEAGYFAAKIFGL